MNVKAYFKKRRQEQEQRAYTDAKRAYEGVVLSPEVVEAIGEKIPVKDYILDLEQILVCIQKQALEIFLLNQNLLEK